MDPRVLASNPLLQFPSSGATRVEPAPLVSAEAAAVEIEAMPPRAPSAAIEIPSNLLRIKRVSFRLVITDRQDLSRVMGSCVNCVKRSAFQKCERNVTTHPLVSIL